MPNLILLTNHPLPLSPVPWIVWGFFKLITPFIDPHTREKLKFNEDMTQYVPREQLWTEYPGGELAFDYDHSVYWPALNRMCAERREARRLRWIAGGSHIGEHEAYLVGAEPYGVGSVAVATGEGVVTEDTEGGGADGVDDVSGRLAGLKTDESVTAVEDAGKQPAKDKVAAASEPAKQEEVVVEPSPAKESEAPAAESSKT